MNYQFYCRASKATKNGLAPIELSITIDGKRKIIQLERKEYPEQFKKLIASKRANDLTQYLDTMRDKINKALNFALLSGQPISVVLIEDYIKNAGVKQYSIQELVTEFLQVQMAKVVAGDCTEGVYRKYTIITNRFCEHIGKRTPCNSITPAQIDVFYSKMRSVYVDATLSGQMFRLKSVFNFGVENGYLLSNPFKVNIQRAKPKIEFLTEEEMKRLQDTDLHSERLDKIRDLAVFQAGSGLAYADLYLLVPEDILTSPEGIKYIYKERQKTGVFFTSVLLPCAISVLDKYNNMLPIVSNQRYNSYLKEIQTLCRIEKTLHTHLFRKTYATYLLNSGCRMDVVAQAMGHTSTRITAATYAFMQKNTVVTEIGNIMLL